MPELRHSSDDEAGYTRIRRGKGWSYHDCEGTKVDDPDVIERLNALAMPPAYSDVWFCADENGHVQATGIDDKGRKQYRYHDAFREAAEEEKFAALADFGRALPKIRRKLDKQLRRRKLTRETVLAAALRLLDRAHLRVGNDQYARTNKSFGATTLRDGHVQRLKTRLKISFSGKHGTERNVTITDPSLVRIIGGARDLPGERLFQYEAEDGSIRAIDSNDVNDYLRELGGGEFTAKTFRTWGASAMAMRQVYDLAKSGEKLTLKSIIEPVAEHLGNTPAVTRSSYVHPGIIDAVKDKPLDPFGDIQFPKRRGRRLSRPETDLLHLIDPDGKPPKRRLTDLIRRR